MKKSIVVCGPQGCGKTLHADRLAAHYGLAIVNVVTVKQLQRRGVLYLSNESMESHTWHHLRAVSFQQAMQEANGEADPSEPKPCRECDSSVGVVCDSHADPQDDAIAQPPALYSSEGGKYQPR